MLKILQARLQFYVTINFHMFKLDLEKAEEPEIKLPISVELETVLTILSKECSNYHTMALMSHASKIMLKILQARLQQYMNHELPDVQAGFQKGRGTRDQIANIHWIIQKAREFQKNIYFCFIDYDKAFDCVDQNKLWKILKEMGIPGHLTSWEICMQVRKQQLELDMEQQTGSK